ncbi:hypothetical protein PENSPDRAFT_80485 [Peniophora sp. CONT]|nr:hypothetical protein PENSPDRAFT_80485 [Peniophora sp. CONT]
MPITKPKATPSRLEQLARARRDRHSASTGAYADPQPGEGSKRRRGRGELTPLNSPPNSPRKHRREKADKPVRGLQTVTTHGRSADRSIISAAELVKARNELGKHTTALQDARDTCAALQSQVDGSALEIVRAAEENVRLRDREQRLKSDKRRIRDDAKENVAFATEQHEHDMQRAHERADVAGEERDVAVERLERAKAEVDRQQDLIIRSRRSANMYRMRATRAKRTKELCQGRMKTVQQRLEGGWLRGRRGAYSFEARRLVRALEAAGCVPKKIGHVLKRVASSFGGKVPHDISARTVGRIKLEGGLMAKVQMAYEIAKTKGLLGIVISHSYNQLN